VCLGYVILGSLAERLQAENTILRREIPDLRIVNNKRNERPSRKHLVLNSKAIVPTEEVCQKLFRQSRQRRNVKLKGKGRMGTLGPKSSDESDNEGRKFTTSLK
jgi:hypothetical protein